MTSRRTMIPRWLLWIAWAGSLVILGAVIIVHPETFMNLGIVYIMVGCTGSMALLWDRQKEKGKGV